MTSIRPTNGDLRRYSMLGSLTLLVVSGLLILFAPHYMPDGYHWLTHTTSEAAAQGLNNAWITRMGFMTFGLAVLWQSSQMVSVWALPARWLHGLFGLCMIATAVFSHKPWWPVESYDVLEDALHSIFATLMGFAFALGVLVRLLQTRTSRGGETWLNVFAIAAATLIPLIMIVLPERAGMVQRLMFLVAYFWYGAQAVWSLKMSGRLVST